MSSLPPSPYGAMPAGPPPAQQPPAAPGKRKWLPWAIGGCGCLVAVAVIAAIVAIALYVASGNSPKAAVEGYEKAWSTADCELLFSVTTEDFRRGLTCAEFEASAGDDPTADLTVLDSRTQGDEAIVVARATPEDASDGDPVDVTFRLVKEDGDWKVDAVSSED
ncbi:nuclear transport factor 2 family protein [Brachybacterium sp. AOP25-B2-12]|uniref:nuclear transport factor 2 family protein n=1 Tax=Brachybacterium sp. AOP25-B2-12 TaxID=3457710 RepID=UPI0040346B7C